MVHVARLVVTCHRLVVVAYPVARRCVVDELLLLPPPPPPSLLLLVAAWENPE